ncbi:Uu.00g141550.m01.CDS01 [Anthostomella pinea]|uniref:Uu.00g141550.m01.CDS01 n=1 Tax=Anthostomella pinea TaxID=933095 RepID=A0AAI8VQY9_9PEZI|nr:Uu.00g141550.m01.CDS01 [Anthostomella pinea]
MSSPLDVVSAIQLLYWPLLLLFAVFVIISHVWKGNTSWLPALAQFLILALIQTVTAILGLSSKGAGGRRVLVASAILDDIAVAPLLIGLTEILIRVNSSLPSGIPFLALATLQVLTILAATLITIGDKVLLSQQPGASGEALAGLGAVLFVIIFAAIFGLSLLSHRKTNGPSSANARGISLSLLVVSSMAVLRLAWMLATIFSSQERPLDRASPDLANVLLHFAMATFPEGVIAGYVLGAGFKSTNVKKDYTALEAEAAGTQHDEIPQLPALYDQPSLTMDTKYEGNTELSSPII